MTGIGRRAGLGLFGAGLAAWKGEGSARAASEEAYPTRPIRVVVPLTAGGSVDLLTRAIAPQISAILGQPLVIENRPGGTTVIGTQLVTRAEPDGYTLLSASSSVELNKFLMRSLPYDPQRDLTPVAQLASIPFVLVVHPQVPVKNLAELIAYARAHPGEVAYASYGIGGPGHLSGELFNRMTGVDTLHVPYLGIPPALVDVIAGRVSMIFSTFPLALPEITNGRLRALAVTSTERVDMLPGVPTLSEAGIPGFESSGWNVLYAPAGTSAAVVMRLNEAITKVLSEASTKEILKTQGFVVAPPRSPDEVKAVMVDLARKWERVIRDAGISL
ncbi:Bug family tripartite tricarboxylate transporter substrate binding protein [Roseomonas chloroacetimidivorans]|uniref:Bug family tripartite tricarboxylate transporter substrate binding protein n=1 Tax=Roseomonas chloroacetimidivorans TaxID=1766656 RepID=UPI003C751FE1